MPASKWAPSPVWDAWAPINEHPRAARSTRFQGPGTVVRFSPIKGITGALSEKIWLPCVLGDIEIDEDALFNEYDTLSNGQYAIGAMGDLSARRLRSGSLDTLTVDFDTPWMVAINQDPETLRNRLKDILRSKKPVHMLITVQPHNHSGPLFDAPVTLRSVNEVMKFGEHDTRYLTISYSEDRSATTRVRQHGMSAGRKKGVDLPATHVLTKDDTLVKLSKQYYGNYEFWRAIRRANGIPANFGSHTPIVKLALRFKPGAKIKIPQIDFPGLHGIEGGIHGVPSGGIHGGGH